MQNSPDMQNGSDVQGSSSVESGMSGVDGLNSANSARMGAQVNQDTGTQESFKMKPQTQMSPQANSQINPQANSQMSPQAYSQLNQQVQRNQQIQGSQQMQGRAGMQGSPVMHTGVGMQGNPGMQGGPRMQGNPGMQSGPRMQGNPYTNRNMQTPPYMQANENSQSCPEKQNAYGGFFARLSAYFVDFIIVQLVLCFIRIPLLIAGSSSGILSNDLLFQYSLTEIILYLAFKAYFIICTYSSGTTLGKRLFRLKVVQTDGEKLTIWNVLYRETIGKYLSGLIINIGYIIIGLTPEKTAFHDYLCDTRVVYTTES